MLNSDLTIFNEFAEKVGNRYVAAKYIADSARCFATHLPKYIIESYLIHWVLIGEKPEHIQVKVRDPEDIRYMNDLLCWIDDEEVVDAVKELYSKSIKNRHLVYQSTKSLSKYQQDRASILLRMIWYQFE